MTLGLALGALALALLALLISLAGISHMALSFDKFNSALADNSAAVAALVAALAAASKPEDDSVLQAQLDQHVSALEANTQAARDALNPPVPAPVPEPIPAV